MYKYDVSLFGSSNKPDLWMRMYNSSLKNKSSFQVVLVGDVKPDFELPNNFKFIYSKVKPSQCYEIAARHCDGKYMNLSGDDLIYDDYYLDNMIKFHKNFCDDVGHNNVVCGGLDLQDCGKNRFRHKKYSPWPGRMCKGRLPMGLFIRSDIWQSLGGIDKNFMGMFWHFDIIFRLIENGGAIGFNKKCAYKEVNYPNSLKKNNIIALSESCGYHDKKYLRDLWFVRWDKKGSNKLSDIDLSKMGIDFYLRGREGYLSKRRSKKVEFFNSDNILEKSQGNTGKWQ
jgi:hypothetical protein